VISKIEDLKAIIKQSLLNKGLQVLSLLEALFVSFPIFSATVYYSGSLNIAESIDTNKIDII